MVSRSFGQHVSSSVVLLWVLVLSLCYHSVAAGADVNLADPNTGNAAQMAAAVGHIEVVERLVEAGCAWPHGKKANTGLGAPVDVVQLLSQKTGISVSSMAELRTAGTTGAEAFTYGQQLPRQCSYRWGRNDDFPLHDMSTTCHDMSTTCLLWDAQQGVLLRCLQSDDVIKRLKRAERRGTEARNSAAAAQQHSSNAPSRNSSEYSAAPLTAAACADAVHAGGASSSGAGSGGGGNGDSGGSNNGSGSSSGANACSGGGSGSTGGNSGNGPSGDAPGSGAPAGGGGGAGSAGDGGGGGRRGNGGRDGNNSRAEGGNTNAATGKPSTPAAKRKTTPLHDAAQKVEVRWQLFCQGRALLFRCLTRHRSCRVQPCAWSLIVRSTLAVTPAVSQHVEGLVQWL